MRTINCASIELSGLKKSTLSSVLRVRLPGSSEESFKSLQAFLTDIPTIANQLSDKTILPLADNNFVDIIYRLQAWSLESYNFQDDFLEDTVLQDMNLNSNLSLYSHLFEQTPEKLVFLQDVDVRIELAKAAIWCSEILKTFSSYVGCIPLNIIPCVLHGYPHKELLDRIAPGIFIFDIIHLFGEIFPFCGEHSFCSGIGLRYVDRPKVEKKDIYKFLGGLMSLSEITNAQLFRIHNYFRSSHPSLVKKKFVQFVSEGAFLFSLDHRKCELQKDSIAEFERSRSTNGPTRCITPTLQEPPVVAQQPRTEEVRVGGTYAHAVGSKARPAAVSPVRPDPEFRPNLLEESGLVDSETMIVRLAIGIFRSRGFTRIHRSSLEELINEEYQRIADEGVSSIEIRFALETSQKFLYQQNQVTMVI